MKLDSEVPRPITWALRVIGWGVGLILIVIAYFVAAHMRMGHHVATCFERMQETRSTAAVLSATHAMGACIDRESSALEKPLLWLQMRSFQDNGMPCKFLGEWKASRPPNLVYAVTLKPDGLFVAKPIVSPDGGTIRGMWMATERRISWLYEGMLVWPPDTNPVRDETATGFTLVESNGSLTRYELVRRIEGGNCR